MDSVAERARRLADRGVGAAIAAARHADLQIEIAEWHLRKVLEIGERLTVADQNRRSRHAEPMADLMNSVVDAPVLEAFAGIERARTALDLLAQRRSAQIGVSP